MSVRCRNIFCDNREKSTASGCDQSWGVVEGCEARKRYNRVVRSQQRDGQQQHHQWNKTPVNGDPNIVIACSAYNFVEWLEKQEKEAELHPLAVAVADALWIDNKDLCLHLQKREFEIHASRILKEMDVVVWPRVITQEMSEYFWSRATYHHGSGNNGQLALRDFRDQCKAGRWEQ